MSSGNKNVMPINWQEVPDKELGLDDAGPKDVAMAKLQEKFQCKQVQEAEEAKKHSKAEEAEKRAHEAEAQCWEVAEAEKQREAEKQEAERAKEEKKQQCAESKAGPSGVQGQESKCMWCTKASAVKNGGEKKKRMRRVQPIYDDDDDIVVTSTHRARKSESRARETMTQMVDRRMGEVVEELQGLRKGVTTMAESNWDIAQVLYHGFQSMDTLVNKVQILGAEGFLPKPAAESEPTKDELQEALREVKELQEEHLEWAMEQLQMRKEWMWEEEATLTKHLKGKGKEPAKEKEQEEEEGGQGTWDEEGEGEAK
ncbi:hypothetical protein ID866_9657 [Astraeus odoratus]|nr:hypothetical protein ID866_9657 [Astraeus odoratus]